MNNKSKKIILDILSYFILISGSLMMIVPFLWMISTSLKPADVTFVLPPKFIPDHITLINYKNVVNSFPIFRFLFNSIFISVTITLGQLLICSMAAYVFARIDFKGRDALFLIYLGTLMIPSQAILTPQYILMNYFGWVNTYKALILPGMFSAFGTFLMRQYFLTIPKSLEEAAFIDGASHLKVFFRIIMPLSKPGLATLTITSFMESWNSFLWPLIITSDDKHITLPLALTRMQGRWHTDYNSLMAGTLITVIPILIVYLLAQKQFIKGITMTGIKG